VIILEPWRIYTQKLFPLRPWPVHNQGWTLIEIAVVAVITGILSSLAIPSMMGMMGRSSLQSTADQVKEAFQEAQRAAIRNGSACTVNFASMGMGITGSPAGCITSPVTLTSGMNLTANTRPFSTSSTITPVGLPSSVLFSYKGNPGNSTNDFANLTVILASTKTTEQRCVVIAAGIGIMRSGTYTNNTCSTAF
jgi:prepilin-type N-terminal cleavage/methylation domain-containing protein